MRKLILLLPALLFYLVVLCLGAANAVAQSGQTRVRAGTPNGVFVDLGLGPRLDSVFQLAARTAVPSD